MDDPGATTRGGAPSSPTPDDARQEIQAIIGQFHGLLSHAMEHISAWCPPEHQQSILDSYKGAGESFGRLQAALNTGAHDANLATWGLSGEHLKPKKELWRKALAIVSKAFSIEGLRTALRWGGVIVSSLSREFPGGEIIRELFEVVDGCAAQFQGSGGSPTAPASGSLSA